MRGKKISDELKKECLRLRLEKNLGYEDIYKELKISKGSLSKILRGYPLPKELINERRHSAILKFNKTQDRKKRIYFEDSKYYKMTEPENLSRHDKEKIAESAILLRLCLLRYIVYGSPFDGDKADWIIEKQDFPGKIKRIQVRWAKQAKIGLPLISLVCMEHGKQKRFKKGDFDFIVGYCLKNDTAYVYSFEETEHLKATVSVSNEAAEAWYKIEAVVAQR